MANTNSEAGQFIYQAVLFDNADLLDELLSAYPQNTAFKDSYGRTPLHLAVQRGNQNIVNLLVKAGANVNEPAGPTVLCATPLHIAAAEGRDEIVKYLVDVGADLFATDLREHCALELAQMNNKTAAAQVLLDAIEMERSRTVYLHSHLISSCIEGDAVGVEKILQKLNSINRDAILNGSSLDNNSALYISCLHGRYEVVKKLLDERGHMLTQPETSDTVLHAAVSSQEPLLVEIILKEFTHLIGSRNADGSTVLHWAAQCGNLQVIKTLMEFPYDESLYRKIEDPSGRFSYDFVIDVNALDSNCRTALYLAVASSHIEVVQYFLEVKLTTTLGKSCPFVVDVYCSGGRTPLMVAAANANIPLVKLLLEYGADVNLPCGLTDADVTSVEGARCIGSGALNEACRANCISLVQLLLQRNAIDQENVALAIANDNHLDALVRLFLSRLVFADPDFRVSKRSIDVGQITFNRSVLPSTLFPNTACMINWHGANLRSVEHEWLLSACLQLNQRLRTSRMALAALTRIDISSNRLTVLNGFLLQLTSLRSLNAANNCIAEIEVSSDNWNAPLLETLLLEHNVLIYLPPQIFSSCFPSLSCVDVSFNKLTALPETLWTAPRLKEFNASNNLLKVLPSVTGVISMPSPSHSSDSRDNVPQDARSFKSTISTEDASSNCTRSDDVNVSVHELKRYNVWQSAVHLIRSEDSDSENGVTTSFSTLNSLNLSHNEIKVFPTGLACCCPRLTRLNLSHNELVSVGPVECFPSRIRHLDLGNNRITVLFSPPEAVQLVCHATAAFQSRSSRNERPSPSRQPRNRSKSAARSQRSLSVARVGDSLHDLHINACVHKQHSRLESLRTLLLNGNRLREIPLTLSDSSVLPKKKATDSKRGDSVRMIQDKILFPLLTSLDISNNCIKRVPPLISSLSSLSVLNLSGNPMIETLPSELGLLGKLWNLNLSGCTLKDPIRSLIQAKNFKTVDLIAYLKSILEDSRPYTRLKLMIVGVQGIGKTSLLQQIRLEGTVGKRGSSSESWSQRMGHTAASVDRTSKGANMSTVGVDIAEWTYEPKKTKGETSFGAVTFRTWDFGGQREYYATHQYFLSRRSLYLVVWRVTDGEAAISDVHQWLINIQARAPNSPVIIVGTHVDQVIGNATRFPSNYLPSLDSLIRERFVMAADADKKGLPRVVDSIFVSSKTKYNIRALCNLLYRTAFDIRTVGGKERLLEQKVPASYLAFEKIVVGLSDEKRLANIEPVMKGSEFRSVVQERMRRSYGRAFRDEVEFNHACTFLHENGVLLHYEDVTLRELYFLNPQWLCDILAHVITIREINPFARNGIMKIDDLQILFKSLRLSRSAVNIRSHIVSLLHKFEVALAWQSRCLLIPSLLPDEYQLRGGYPGSRVVLTAKVNGWELECHSDKCTNVQNCGVSRVKYQKEELSQLNSSLNQLNYQEKEQTFKKSECQPKDTSEKQGVPNEHHYIVLSKTEKDNLRRIYAMAYIPSGFWSRLMARILSDDRLAAYIERIFYLPEFSEPEILDKIKNVLDNQFHPKWLLWQTGFEVIASGQSLFMMRQYLPLAEVRDVSYERIEWWMRGEDLKWRATNLQNSAFIEIVIPSYSITVTLDRNVYILETNHSYITRLLSLVVDIMDTFLEDWYPSLGTRFMHTSEGHLLINRLVPCPDCVAVPAFRKMSLSENYSKKGPESIRSQTISDFCEVNTRFPVYAFTIEECILSAHENAPLHCPSHHDLNLSIVAPDTVFLDIKHDFLISPEVVKRNKLIGRGAFGFVFKATICQKDRSAEDAALKLLEPVEPGIGARSSSIAAFKAAQMKWQRSPLQSACYAYITCRQELSVLSSLRHPHITALLGICIRPLALVVELAPLGALSHLLSNYRRSGARLHLSVIQDTANQVAKALEYLHEHHIIYRDLKCENVLTWRFPPPFSALTEVVVKLGDYGISRSSFPSGGAKGFGGTEGFMAPEIMRYNGEQEYTEKVDCFSFAMFLYELISLKLPFDGHEQLKDYVLEGGRPQLTPSEILYPSNVLDMMVVCWAAKPSDRPSASQIVSMTTAPEFTHLLDAIALDDPNSFITASVAISTSDDSEGVSIADDNLENEVWLSRSDGTVTVLGCNQYGWLDSKSISMSTEKTVVTAMCVVNDTVWLAESTGFIRIYCRSSYMELHSFSIARLLPTPALSIDVQHMSVLSHAPLLILLTLPSTLLILKGEKGNEGTFACMTSVPTVHSVAVTENDSNNKEVWCGHNNGVISIYELLADGRLVINSTLVHNEVVSNSSSNSKMTCLVTSNMESSFIWSAIHSGSKIFQWSVHLKATLCKLDAQKIFPSSESISTLDVEAAQEGHITSLALLDKLDGPQLYVGTSKGVVIVAQAQQMRPLAAFRPYVENVHRIIVLDGNNAFHDCRKNLRAARSSGSSGETGLKVENSRNSTGSTTSSEFLDTVSWVKNRVTETVSNLRTSTDDQCVVQNGYVVTIGDGYRCLIDRFTNRENDRVPVQKSEPHCAIIWRTEDWVA